MRAGFNNLDLARKKQFIDNLTAKLRGVNNPQYSSFLRECVARYDDEMRRSHMPMPYQPIAAPESYEAPLAPKKRGGALKAVLIVMSSLMAVLIIGVVTLIALNTGTRPGSGYTAQEGADVGPPRDAPSAADENADVVESLPGVGLTPIEAASYSLEEIQNRPGVYIKRNNRFYRLPSWPNHGGSEVEYQIRPRQPMTVEERIIVTDPAIEYVRVYPSDHIVFVGSATPRAYSLLHHGYTATRVSWRRTSNGIGRTPYDGWGQITAYTHINEQEIRHNPNALEQHLFRIFIQNRLAVEDIYIFVGSYGQTITLGRFEGTNWRETVLTANSPFYRPEALSTFVEQTRYGYFYLDFVREPGSVIAIRSNLVMPTYYIIEIPGGGPAAAVADEADDPPVTPPASSALIVGEWRIVESADPVTIYGMQNGWMYDLHFLDDGTGVGRWFSPLQNRWFAVATWTWFALDGNLTETLTWVNHDVLNYYMGEDFTNSWLNIVGFPYTYNYSFIDENTLRLTLGNDFMVLRRNPPPEAQPASSALFIGEWRVVESADPLTAYGIQDGWMYEDHFFADGTGVSRWLSPHQNNWSEIITWTWFALDGNMTQTMTSVNFEVVAQVMGADYTISLMDAVGIPFGYNYSFVDENTLILTMGDTVVWVLHRN